MGTVGYGEAASWSSIQEQTLFREDGLKLVVNLTEIPTDVQVLESTTNQRDGVDSDLNSSEFCVESAVKELQALFVTQTSQYARYFRYRQNALEKLWETRGQLKKSSPKLTSETTRKDGQLTTVTKRRVDFSSRVSLLLLIPLIKSHSKIDPSLAEHSTQILFQCLKDCLPNSLSEEPLSCVTRLADLLTGWLAEQNVESVGLEHAHSMEKAPSTTTVRKETIIGCLLSLACARYNLSSLNWKKSVYISHACIGVATSKVNWGPYSHICLTDHNNWLQNKSIIVEHKYVTRPLPSLPPPPSIIVLTTEPKTCKLQQVC